MISGRGGRTLVTLKTAWHDGTTHLVFEPLEFLEKLAALTGSDLTKGE